MPEGGRFCALACAFHVLILMTRSTSSWIPEQSILACIRVMLRVSDSPLMNCATLSLDFTMAGVGGSQSYYREPALVIVNDSDGERTFNITLSVTSPQLPTPSNPRPVVNLLLSLLGRDVLNRLRIDYDYPAGRLRFFP